MNTLSLSLESPEYPPQLNTLKSPPKEIWIKGVLPPVGTPLVGIVGTRQASEWGKKMAFEFANRLAKGGIWVVSGLALGIDTAAHQGALGKTIGVIGSGLDHIYPSENKELAAQIVVMTEYSPETKPQAWRFPKRNALVAALCDVLLVIEAPEKSGALITARLMHGLNKKCFVLPGPIDRENFRGSNLLIKEGKGELCLGVEEIFTFLKKGCPAITPSVTATKYTNPEELNILMLLEKEDLSFDQLSLLTGLAANRLNVFLMTLVLNKKIKEYAGKIYGKVSNYC